MLDKPTAKRLLKNYTVYASVSVNYPRKN